MGDVDHTVCPSPWPAHRWARVMSLDQSFPVCSHEAAAQVLAFAPSRRSCSPVCQPTSGTARRTRCRCRCFRADGRGSRHERATPRPVLRRCRAHVSTRAGPRARRVPGQRGRTDTPAHRSRVPTGSAGSRGRTLREAVERERGATRRRRPEHPVRFRRPRWTWHGGRLRACHRTHGTAGRGPRSPTRECASRRTAPWRTSVRSTP